MGEIKEVKEMFESANSPTPLSSAYIKTIDNVVDKTTKHLENQNNIKKDLRDKFTTFFKRFILVQYIVLVALVVLNASIKCFVVSEAVLLTYISSVFVETLGVITIMITFAYNNKTEKSVLDILKELVKNFKI